MLTILFVPSVIIKLLPFIIFVTSMKFIVDIRNNKDLLNIKVFGYSNLKVFLFYTFTSFNWMDCSFFIALLLLPCLNIMIKQKFIRKI